MAPAWTYSTESTVALDRDTRAGVHGDGIGRLVDSGQIGLIGAPLESPGAGQREVLAVDNLREPVVVKEGCDVQQLHIERGSVERGEPGAEHPGAVAVADDRRRRSGALLVRCVHASPPTRWGSGVVTGLRSVEQVGLLAGDPGEQRLETEPAGEMRSHLSRSVFGHRGSMSTGVPAASAISWAWQDRSMVMNHQAASSTDWPTVSRPWLRRMTALQSPSAWAMRLPSSRSSTTPEYWSNRAWSS